MVHSCVLKQNSSYLFWFVVVGKMVTIMVIGKTWSF